MYTKSKIFKIDNNDEFDFEKGDELCDMKLIVENKVLYVHKAILGTVSPVFRKMFTSDFKEKLIGEVSLPDKKFDDIIELLNVIYPNKSKEIDESKIESLLELSEEYDIMKIRNICENKLIKNINDLNNIQKKLYGKAIDHQLDKIIYFIELSYKFRLKKLNNDCIDYLSKTFDEKLIEKNSFYSSINDNDKLEILRKKLNLLDEKLLNKDKRIKQLEDENLKQKFEIQRLKSLITTNNNEKIT